MEIKLLKQPVAEIDGSVAVVSEKSPLSLSFKSEYDLSNAFLSLKNGGKKLENIALTPKFNVPKELLFEGRLFISVDMYIDGEVVKSWRVPPIRIKEADKTEFEAYPELQALTTLFFDLKDEVEVLKKELTTHIKKSNEII